MERQPAASHEEPSIKIWLHIAASIEASRLDSDPHLNCVATLQTQPSTEWVPLGTTEIINETREPKWITTLQVDYKFGQKQFIKFDVFDNDASGRKIIGSAEVKFGSIVKVPHFELEIIHGPTEQPAGKLIILGEEDVISKQNVVLQFKGVNLEDKDTFSKSDPFFRIYRKSDTNEWIIVYESEVIQDNLNPEWAPMLMGLSNFCRSNLETEMRFEVYDYDDESTKDLIGLFEAKAKHILQPHARFQLINPKYLEKKKHINVGEVEVDEVNITEAESFIDYIKGGISLNLSIAIDYTSSNGLVVNDNSLHKLHEDGQKNEYEKAITALYDILEPYDNDKRFPVFGFGGIPHWLGLTSHCFAINHNEGDPYVEGLQGILSHYHQSLSEITLDGPTHFSDILKRISFLCQSDRGNVYHILLILTDGEIHDKKETIDQIVAASNLPLSIIIVGVGYDDFTNLIELDSDRLALKDSNGKSAFRDIVQFVPFRKFRSEPMLLAKEALGEIPKQVLSYFKQVGINVRQISRQH